MTKIIVVEKKEDCNRLEECGVQCLALDGQPCPGPDHPDCPLDDEHLCDDCLELTHGDAIKTMTELKKENAEKDKEIKTLNKALKIKDEEAAKEIEKWKNKFLDADQGITDISAADFDLLKRWQDKNKALEQEKKAQAKEIERLQKIIDEREEG